MLKRNIALSLLWGLFLGSAAHGGPDFSRYSVLEFSVSGYAPLKEVRSFLDVGLKREENSQEFCEILRPLSGTLASKRSWVPFDFYTNVLTPEEQAEERTKRTLGEANIFFPGDNFNRNNSDKSHEWTRQVAANFKGSLDFLEPQISKTSFSFVLKFTRGLLSYGGFIRVNAWVKKGQCEAGVFLCANPVKQADGKTSCDPGQWTRKIRHILAEASVSGAMSDRFSGVVEEKKKNDIASLSIEFQDVDSSGEEVGSTYVEKVATK